MWPAVPTMIDFMALQYIRAKPFNRRVRRARREEQAVGLSGPLRKHLAFEHAEKIRKLFSRRSLRLKAFQLQRSEVVNSAKKSPVHECPENATIELPHMSTATLAITPELLRDHGLTAEEYDRIKSLLGGREPTFTELGIFSVMWSEHCSYKSSRVHLKRLPTRSRRVLQGPGENAGIIDIGDGWACAFKIESHNHPSFIEPFQGATTGVGGILRDIFTMGAPPVAVMDSLRFGPISVGKSNMERAPSPATAGAEGKAGNNTHTTSATTQAELHKNHSVLEGV